MSGVRHRRGFTLIEVLVAAAVLSTLSAGVLVTTWRLAQFAHDEAERLAADAICADVFWTVYSVDYDRLGESSFDVGLRNYQLPVVETRNWRGEVRVRRLLRPTDSHGIPKCNVVVADPSIDGNGRLRRKITVQLKWQHEKVGSYDRSHQVEGYRYQTERTIEEGGS